MQIDCTISHNQIYGDDLARADSLHFRNDKSKYPD